MEKNLALKLFAALRKSAKGEPLLLARREQIGTKAKKSFTAIVQETPRLEGELSHGWPDLILKAAEQYDTHVPDMLSEELLIRLSRRGLKKRLK